jgi:hypothetical protein
MESLAGQEIDMENYSDTPIETPTSPSVEGEEIDMSLYSDTPPAGTEVDMSLYSDVPPATTTVPSEESVAPEKEAPSSPSMRRRVAYEWAKSDNDVTWLGKIRTAATGRGRLDVSVDDGIRWLTPEEEFGKEFTDATSFEERRLVMTRILAAKTAAEYSDVIGAGQEALLGHAPYEASGILPTVVRTGKAVLTPTSLIPAGLVGKLTVKALPKVASVAGLLGAEWSIMRQAWQEGSISGDELMEDMAYAAVFGPAAIAGIQGAAPAARKIGGMLGRKPGASKEVPPKDLSKKQAKDKWEDIRGEQAFLWTAPVEELPERLRKSIGEAPTRKIKKEAIEAEMATRHSEIFDNMPAFLEKAGTPFPPSMGPESAKNGNVLQKHGQGIAFLEGIDRNFGVVSTRLKNLDEAVGADNIRTMFNVSWRTADYGEQVQELGKVLKKHPEGEVVWNMIRDQQWDLAEKSLLKATPDGVAVLNKVRQSLKEVFDEKVSTGQLDPKSEIVDYAPRLIKDVKKYRAALSTKDRHATSEAIRAAEKASPSGKITSFQEADIFNKAMRREIQGAAPSANKARVFKDIAPEHEEFYHKTESAMHSYFTEAVVEAEKRKLFGHTSGAIQTRKVYTKNMTDVDGNVTTASIKDKLPPVEHYNTRMYKATSPEMGAKKQAQMKAAAGTKHEKGKEYWSDNIEYADGYRKLYGEGATIDYIDVPTKSLKGKKGKTGQGKYLLSKSDLRGGGKLSEEGGKFDLRGSVGASLSSEARAARGLKPLNKELLSEMESILGAVYGAHDKRPNAFFATLKDVSYLSLLANAGAGVIQLGDGAIVATINGIDNTIEAAVKRAGRSVTRTPQQTDVRRQQGVSLATREMAGERATAKFLTEALYWGYFTKPDIIMKNLSVEASAVRAGKIFAEDGSVAGKNMAALYDKYANAWGDEKVGLLIRDIKAYKGGAEPTMIMREYGYTELSRSQPISDLEVPQAMLEAENGKVWYQLAVWSIRQAGVYREIAYNEMRNGNWEKGVENMTRLAVFLGGANAGLGVVHDFILGREVDLTAGGLAQRLGEGVMRTIALNKHNIKNSNTVEDFFVNTFLPAAITQPLGAATNVYKSFVGDDESKAKNREKVWRSGLRSAPFIQGKLWESHFGGAEKYDANAKKQKKREAREKRLSDMGR